MFCVFSLFSISSKNLKRFDWAVSELIEFTNIAGFKPIRPTLSNWAPHLEWPRASGVLFLYYEIQNRRKYQKLSRSIAKYVYEVIRT